MRTRSRTAGSNDAMTLNQPPPMPTHQINLEDESHLHLLSVFHFVINCTFFPYGTVLGVFTIIVLQRPTVKMTYAANTRI